jgi:CelD/BcsL family acetyltransferase involved in cellulose biosynthesis
MTLLTGTEYRTELVASRDAWEEMAGAWNDLLESSRSHSVFLTWEWLFSWAECFLNGDRRLFIVTVYSGKELIGIAPWYLHPVSRNLGRVEQLEFLGSPEAGSDYLDIIIQAGREEDVAGALYEFLFHQDRSAWDTLLLRDIPSDSLFLLHFQEKLEQDGKYAELCKGSYCPVVTFPKSAGWTPGVSAKRRARFKQDLGRLNKGGGMHHRIVRGAEVPDGLDEFFRFYNLKSGHQGDHIHRFLKKFSARSAGKDLLQIDFLNIGGTTAAGLLHLVYHGEVLLFTMAVDKEFNPKISVGNLLVGLCLKQAAAGGRTRYDFLKGNERYKFHWADDGRSSIGIFTVQKKLSPALYAAGRFMKYTAKILLR